MRFLGHAAVAAVAAISGFHVSSARLSPAVRNAIVVAHEWQPSCPVSFSQLRVLTLTYHGFDGRTHWGQLVVNQNAVIPLSKAFRRLYAIGFPIRHMQLYDTYGPDHGRPADGDFTASFECRQASASPCGGLANKTTGSWSEHAYGEAIDLNPVENPYVGCGMTRDRTALSYVDRSHLRRGMVTPAVIAAFTSAGWRWGGAWSGSTKDYMHFSANGH